MTTKITQFDKTNLKQVRVALDAALKQVGAEFGIELGIKNISFDIGGFRTTLEGTIAEQKAADDRRWLETFCDINDLDPDKVSNDGFVLVRYDAKKHSKPWVIRKAADTSDKPALYLCDDRSAKLRFAKAPAEPIEAPAFRSAG